MTNFFCISILNLHCESRYPLSFLFAFLSNNGENVHFRDLLFVSFPFICANREHVMTEHFLAWPSVGQLIITTLLLIVTTSILRKSSSWCSSPAEKKATLPSDMKHAMRYCPDMSLLSNWRPTFKPYTRQGKFFLSFLLTTNKRKMRQILQTFQRNLPCTY